MNITYNSGMANLAHPKVRRQKFGVGKLLLCVVAGAAFIVVGVLTLQSSKINPSWSRVNGTVVSVSSSISNGSTTYTPVVRYEVNGQSYTVGSTVSSGSYPAKGSARQVAYDPQQPNHAKIVTSAQNFLYVFPAIGVVLVILGPVLFVRSLRRSDDIKHLMQSGQKLQGVLTDIQSFNNTANMNSTTTVQQRTTYKLVVSATDAAGAVQTYVSDSLTGIGGLAMADFRTNPIPIDVYVDPANPEKYYVDVAEVPTLTPERISQLIQSVAHRQQGESVVAAQPVQPAAAPQVTVPQPAPTVIAPSQPVPPQVVSPATSQPGGETSPPPATT